MNNIRPPKPPREIFPTVYSFTPNRETLGGTAYFIVEKSGNTLVDCPPWHDGTIDFLQEKGGVTTLFITHRSAISNQVAKIQTALNCEIVIQEQEAYLMPEAEVTPFRDSWQRGALSAIWTPGFSPGSSCLYYDNEGGCLFTGRHLLPNQKAELLALRTAKTFHWGRQLKGIDKLIQAFSAATLSHILPAANVGFLREQRYVADAYLQLEHALERSQAQPEINLS